MKIKQTAAILLLCASAAVRAETTAPQPSGVMSLQSQASAEVSQDTVLITLFAEQQGNDPATISSNLNQKAAEAVKLARSQSAVSVQTGNVSLYPTNDRNGKISSWRGRTELLLKSKDFAAASRLVGQLGNLMQMGGISFELSDEARRATEAKLADEAIASFKAQAQANSRAFGYTGYTIRQVNVGHSAPPMPRPFMAMSAAAAPMAKAEDMPPIEGGKTRVTVNVNGSVQMTH